MSNTQFSRYIDSEGRITFKIGDQALDPTNRKEQIAVAHLLRTYDHSDNTHIAGQEWVKWLGVERSDADRHSRLMRAWRMFTRKDDIATVAKLIGPILEEVLDQQPDQTARHPVRLVVRVSHDKCDPNPITLTLFVEDLRIASYPITCRQLDPNIHDDIEMAIYCLKSQGVCCSPIYKAQSDAFRLLNNWYRQASEQVADQVLLTWWESVSPPDAPEPLEPFATDYHIEGTNPVLADEPVQSSRSRIGQVLNRFTQSAGDVVGYSFDLYSSESVSEDTISDSSLVVQNLPELQQQLADLVETLITERIGQQQVLKARGATVLDCHQLGLLSDDDMANHMADCLMVIMGKPVSAKAAKSIILGAADLANDTPIDFNQDVILQPPPREVTNIGWETPVRVSFDGAEGQGRVWLHTDHEHDENEPSIAIPGVDNARHLAKLLNAWADAYNPKSEQPE